MCQVDRGAAAAAIATLTAAHPYIAQKALPHPALTGCDDVAWSAIPGCPPGVPVVLRALLDPDAAEEAEQALGWLVMSAPLRMSPVMPIVVPFLLRLAADSSVPRRGELFDLVLVAAALSEPSDPDNAADLAINGSEEDHPERSLCRAAFAANANWVSRLLADPSLQPATEGREYDRAYLFKAAGL